MLGNNDHPGVMLRCLNELFSNVDTQLANFRIKLSYLEIYNENIRDLLTSDDRTLDLREDPKAGI